MNVPLLFEVFERVGTESWITGCPLHISYERAIAVTAHGQNSLEFLVVLPH